MRTPPSFATLVVASIAALLSLAGAPAASAHDVPELRLHARRTADRILVSIEADTTALARIARGGSQRGALDVVTQALCDAVVLTTAEGVPLLLHAQSTGPSGADLETDAPKGDVVLSLSLFGSDDPGEAVVRLGRGQSERLLRLELPGIVRLSASIETEPSTDVASFVRSGVGHILTGWDHLAFLAVLLVVGRRLRDVLVVATAFTIAHSLTLTLAAFDLVRVPSGPVEAAIAASIVLAAVGNVLAEAPRHRAVLAFSFGLVHGLGFSSGLAEMLEGSTLNRAGAVFGFNVGVELGQLAVLLVVTPLLLAWRRRAPRGYALVCVRATSVAIAALGCVWLFERTFG